MRLFKEIKTELARNFSIESISHIGIICKLIKPKSWGIILIRLAARGNRVGGMLLQIFFHSEVCPRVRLGSSLWIPHPYGIVMAEGTEIGDNCAIYQRTTFAEKGGVHKGPKIGNNTVVGTGTVVVGDIVVGDNVKIGPNSVVIKDVEDNVIVFGNPLQTKAVKKSL